MELLQAAKCAIVSIDSTVRSNVAVALPIDMMIMNVDECRVAMQQRIEPDDPYYLRVSRNGARAWVTCLMTCQPRRGSAIAADRAPK